MDFSEYKVTKIKLSPEMALYKIKNWCAYQERSQDETRWKLLSFGLFKEDADEIIAQLIGENFLNEERFSIALASGKFNIKHWGRIKIKMELKKHKVSEYCINKALQSLDNTQYELVLTSVLEKKLRMTLGGTAQKKYYAALSYAVSRGFESNLASEVLDQLLPRR